MEKRIKLHDFEPKLDRFLFFEFLLNIRNLDFLLKTIKVLMIIQIDQIRCEVYFIFWM
jgi:hypothetical protein